MNRLKTNEEDIETAGKHDNHQRKSCKIHWKMLERYSEGKCDNNLAGNVITTRIKGAKSVGTWRKPERLLGTNYDDAVNMLEKYSESAGKCENNQRKWCKKDRKMKETGKTLGLTLILKRYEMPETRGNGAKSHRGKR